MELYVTIAIIFAAIFHATWNGLMKGGKDPLLDSMVISIVWLVIAVISIPFLPLPHPSSWAYIAVSSIIHIVYFFLLAKSYDTGELSRVYPIIRGLPPLIIAVVSFVFLNEGISFWGWAGIIVISLGILALEFGNKTPSKKVLLLSVATAIMVASYTIIDGLGARLSGNSISFLLWFASLQGIIYTILVVAIRGKQRSITHVKLYWRRGAIGGVLSLFGYGIILWAMTKAPIAYVSALRETSVLFASIIAVVFLAEPLKKSRIISAILIVSGIILMRLSL